MSDLTPAARCDKKPPIPDPMGHEHRCNEDPDHKPSDRHTCRCGLRWSEGITVGSHNVQMLRIPTDVAYGSAPGMQSVPLGRRMLPPLPESAYPEDAVPLPEPEMPEFVDYELEMWPGGGDPIFVRGVDDVASSATHIWFFCRGRMVYAHPADRIRRIRAVGVEWPT